MFDISIYYDSFAEDLYMHSRFMNYSMGIKSVAFIPSIVCFVVFFTLIIVYGRITPERSNSDVPASNTPLATGPAKLTILRIDQGIFSLPRDPPMEPPTLGGFPEGGPEA